MILLQSMPLLHNHLLISVTLIVLGFLGMLLQRNALATVLSLLLWLQGAGLVFASYGQYQGTREGNFYFLLMLFVVITLLCTLAALVFHARRNSQPPQIPPKVDEPRTLPITQEGTRPGG
ncbi:MAG: NADH-quinone oxidoreductase subunit K [Planctomycetota bacterium]|jgi:NADH-quinone oxidoreductase subunit K|uniref:NADH-quinone oxidoreductase subunit K n=1 Tax=uncultured Gimesia sp. TaxID=1678688 RepID=UPI002614AAC4|nr:NADH-quinone oxidoreductase subunit K [uncultured Gimesia sp.]